MPVAFRRGTKSRAPSGLADDVGRVYAVSFRERKEPCEAARVQKVPSRKEKQRRRVLRADGEDVGFAEARGEGEAFVVGSEAGESFFVKVPYLGFAVFAFVYGGGYRGSFSGVRGRNPEAFYEFTRAPLFPRLARGCRVRRRGAR